MVSTELNHTVYERKRRKYFSDSFYSLTLTFLSFLCRFLSWMNFYTFLMVLKRLLSPFCQWSQAIRKWVDIIGLFVNNTKQAILNIKNPIINVITEDYTICSQVKVTEKLKLRSICNYIPQLIWANVHIASYRHDDKVIWMTYLK